MWRDSRFLFELLIAFALSLWSPDQLFCVVASWRCLVCLRGRGDRTSVRRWWPLGTLRPNRRGARRRGFPDVRVGPAYELRGVGGLCVSGLGRLDGQWRAVRHRRLRLLVAGWDARVTSNVMHRYRQRACLVDAWSSGHGRLSLR